MTDDYAGEYLEEFFDGDLAQLIMWSEAIVLENARLEAELASVSRWPWVTFWRWLNRPRSLGCRTMP